MRTPTRRLATLAAASGLALSGCAIDLPASAPMCDADEVLTLMAQAVPQAQQIPCIDDLPEGWSVVDFEGQTGRVRFTLSHPVAGDGALEVRFAATCEEAADHAGDGGGELPPLELPGGDEQLQDRGDLLQGHVVDEVEGGCVVRTYDFDTIEEQDLRRDLDEEFTTIRRDALAQRLRQLSGGRLELDPS